MGLGRTIAPTFSEERRNHGNRAGWPGGHARRHGEPSTSRIVPRPTVCANNRTGVSPRTLPWERRLAAVPPHPYETAIVPYLILKNARLEHPNPLREVQALGARKILKRDLEDQRFHVVDPPGTFLFDPFRHPTPVFASGSRDASDRLLDGTGLGHAAGEIFEELLDLPNRGSEAVMLGLFGHEDFPNDFTRMANVSSLIQTFHFAASSRARLSAPIMVHPSHSNLSRGVDLFSAVSASAVTVDAEAVAG
jgi:hypothetical protein